MTGESLKDMKKQYLWEHGFDGMEPAYVPEGDEILLFDPSKIEVEPVERFGGCEDDEADEDDDEHAGQLH